jgi:hypothetical protein
LHSRAANAFCLVKLLHQIFFSCVFFPAFAFSIPGFFSVIFFVPDVFAMDSGSSPGHAGGGVGSGTVIFAVGCHGNVTGFYNHKILLDKLCKKGYKK